MDEHFWNAGDDRLVITVRGDMDAVIAHTLQLRLVVLVGEAPGRLELDPSRVDFLDCAGSRTLAALHRTAAAHGGSLRMALVSPAAIRLFELADPRDTVPRILPLPETPVNAPGAGAAYRAKAASR